MTKKIKIKLSQKEENDEIYLSSLKNGKYNILEVDDSVASEVDELFDKLADAQRGAPESAMLRTTRLFGGGSWSVLLEHVGDLIHRMAQKPLFFRGGYDYVKEKVDRAKIMLDGYEGPGRQRIESEFDRTLDVNAEFRVKDGYFENEDDFKQKLFENAKRYADEHSQLPAYNEMHIAARQAAVNVGLRNFDLVRKNIEILNEEVQKGNEHWANISLTFYVENGNIKTF